MLEANPEVSGDADTSLTQLLINETQDFNDYSFNTSWLLTPSPPPPPPESSPALLFSKTKRATASKQRAIIYDDDKFDIKQSKIEIRKQRNRELAAKSRQKSLNKMKSLELTVATQATEIQLLKQLLNEKESIIEAQQLRTVTDREIQVSKRPNLGKPNM